MSDHDIVDRIDELVDAALNRPVSDRSGYDNNVNQDKCWHCGRGWHGLAITQRMEDMRRGYAAQQRVGNIGESSYATSAIMGDYRYDTDDSAILCPGSEFIGPLDSPRASSFPAEYISFSGWLDWLRDTIGPTRVYPQMHPAYSQMHAQYMYGTVDPPVTMSPVRSAPCWWNLNLLELPEGIRLEYREEPSYEYVEFDARMPTRTNPQHYLEVYREPYGIIDKVRLMIDPVSNNFMTRSASYVRIFAHRPPNIGRWVQALRSEWT